MVDDNRDAADSLAIALKMNGHDVSTAYDGKAAVEAITLRQPHVAIIDIGMPGFDGYQVARALRDMPWRRNLVLIALTGWGQDEDKLNTQRAGFDHHLTKPADPDRIDALLAKVSGRGVQPVLGRGGVSQLHEPA